FDRKPREGGYERRPREDGDRPARSYVKREGGYDRKPRPDFNRGESKAPKFAEKRTIKRDRAPKDEDGLLRGDGWLIGYHAVLAALGAGRRKVRNIWLLGEAQGQLGELIAAHPEWSVEIKAKPDFEQQFGDMVHQGVAA